VLLLCNVFPSLSAQTCTDYMTRSTLCEVQSLPNYQEPSLSNPLLQNMFRVLLVVAHDGWCVMLDISFWSLFLGIWMRRKTCLLPCMFSLLLGPPSFRASFASSPERIKSPSVKKTWFQCVIRIRVPTVKADALAKCM
jgi:hypothetical protein